jgi:hypothetical protein
MKACVTIGLNGVDAASYAGWPGYLVACDSDATGYAAAFATLGYSSTAIFDAKATLSTFRNVLTAAAASTQAGDWFVLTYSGHGGQTENWGFSGYKETLCLYDGQLADSELHNLLTAFRPGANVVIVLDSCHSGGMDRGIMKRIRVAPFHIVRQTLPAAVERDGDIVANVGFMTACRADEVAEDGDTNGAFTGSNLLSLTSTVITWADWYGAVQAYMLRYYPRQHPQWISVAGSIEKQALRV